MLELLPALPQWQPASSGAPCAVATVVSASGSVPRPVGTSMLVAASPDGAPHVLGSLSGGCVEGAVVAAALDAMHDGAARLERFGYSPEDAFAAGLTCGGELEVHIAPLPSAALGALAVRAAHDAASPASADTAAGAPLAVVRVLSAGAGAGSGADDGAAGLALLGAAECSGPDALAEALGVLFPGRPGIAARAAALAAPVVAQGVTAVVALEPEGGCAGPGPHFGDTDPHVGVTDPHLGETEAGPLRILIESRLPAPRMLVVGANDFGAALIPAARLLGYRVTLVDARPAFAGQTRFAPGGPSAPDEVAVAWPHEYLAAEAAAGRLDARSALCVLSHDPKFDIPLLDAALGLDLAYLGAMGSRRSHEQRIAALLTAGHGPLDLGRLRSPIGLDLGAATPAEVAVSILAELVSSRHPGAGTGPLRDRGGRIHAGSPATQAAPRTAEKGQPSWT
ncbi:XdhC family protein [Sinomonas mesophila]|uniref:XdhC family protein n=1 Tax=Sinomonas mesophila TaxID=1531955 RepID=UPI0009856D43|nr:XdhC/CoxI family protein [Sinomonas mesophila]